MYVINRGDDGHQWTKSSKLEQPKHRKFKKLYCIFCGAKAYTVDKTRISLTGEYYSGEIRQCTSGVISHDLVLKKKKKSKKWIKKMLKKKIKKKMVRNSLPKMIRTT